MATSSNPDQPPTFEFESIPLPQSPNSSPQPPPSLLRLSFNQDQTCFVAAVDTGFRIYSCHPFRERFRCRFTAGGISHAEMLFRTSIFAIAISGSSYPFHLNKVILWDDYRSRCFRRLSFRAAVCGIRLCCDHIIVVLERNILVYNCADFRQLHEFETAPNLKGLCAVSQVVNSLVLACPGLLKGQVRVEHFQQNKTKFVLAHQSGIECIALTHDGKFLATASTKGTLIRIFHTSDGTLLQEVRRGANPAVIYSLAFSFTAQWLAVSSNTGTVHVFRLKLDSELDSDETDGESVQSSTHFDAISAPSSIALSFIKFKEMLPKYFHSEWSSAQFRLREDSHYTVAFGHQPNTIIILGMNGSFYRCEFDPVNGGEMTQLEYHNFLKSEIVSVD